MVKKRLYEYKFTFKKAFKLWYDTMRDEFNHVHFWSAITRNYKWRMDAHFDSPWGKTLQRYKRAYYQEDTQLSYSDWVTLHYWDNI